MTQPQIRKPPLRDHFRRQIQAALQGCNCKDTIPENVVFVIWNVGKDGNDGDIQKVFCYEEEENAEGGAGKKKKGVSALKKTICKIGVGYTEQSLSDRRDQIRGFGTVEQTETVYIVSGSALKVEKKARLHFKGTTAGSWIFPVSLPPYNELWQLSFGEKKKLFGDARVAVGGPTAGQAAGTAKIRPRLDEDVEPVFYHYQGYELMSEIVHTLGGQSKIELVVDLTAGVGDLACLAKELRVSYLGWTFTEFHAERLRAPKEVHGELRRGRPCPLYTCLRNHCEPDPRGRRG